MDHNGTWHGGGPWSRPHCARFGTQLPYPKRGKRPQFSTHFYCGETAGCIKMQLGMEVGLGPGRIMLDWDPAPPIKGAQPPPQFSAHVYCGQDILPPCQVSSWSIQPFGHNTPTSQTGQTGQDRQWSDSIGRTVLQTVTQNKGLTSKFHKKFCVFRSVPWSSDNSGIRYVLLVLWLVISWSIQPFGHNRHGPKIGGRTVTLFGGSWVPIYHRQDRQWSDGIRWTFYKRSPKKLQEWSVATS